MFVPVLILILGFCGLALELGQLYNRKIELHGMAKAAVLAAANELNGTTAGIVAAKTQAAAIAAKFRYNYKHSFTWTDEAISFSSTPPPHAVWVKESDVGSNAANMFYVKVDTSKLDVAIGSINLMFMRVVPGSSATAVISDRAVAGRTSVRVTPLAICAMSADPGGARGTELVQYGFRRGVSYNLMQLNPGGLSPENFVIDPTIVPGDFTSSSNTSVNAVGRYVCTGTMWMPRVTGGDIRVSRPFPIGSLYRHLNSRFDQYEDNVCSPNGAPPDSNVKPYGYVSGAPWMSPAQASQTAAPDTSNGKLLTIAHGNAPPSGTTAAMYGPLWSYAKAVKHSAYVANAPEPTSGYTTFGTADWSTLYQPGPSASGYPTGAGATPYKVSITPPPNHPKLGEEHRRVLHVPLLSCPVPSGTTASASVLAIAKFFMTIPADSASIPAEFAGLVPEQSLGGAVELFP